jgi:hypothetical protein
MHISLMMTAPLAHRLGSLFCCFHIFGCRGGLREVSRSPSTFMYWVNYAERMSRGGVEVIEYEEVVG